MPTTELPPVQPLTVSASVVSAGGYMVARLLHVGPSRVFVSAPERLPADAEVAVDFEVAERRYAVRGRVERATPLGDDAAFGTSIVCACPDPGLSDLVDGLASGRILGEPPAHGAGGGFAEPFPMDFTEEAPLPSGSAAAGFAEPFPMDFTEEAGAPSDAPPPWAPQPADGARPGPACVERGAARRDAPFRLSPLPEAVTASPGPGAGHRPRRVARHPVAIFGMVDQGRVGGYARLYDLSLAGARLTLDGPVEGLAREGQLVRLRLHLREPGPITLWSQVAWVSPDATGALVGLVFVDLDPDAAAALAALVQTLEAPGGAARVAAASTIWPRGRR